ncbi:hypothetical protein RCJ22_14015 [Vibrio sp. FNV 38]|nr:hypothetical protein [Vibrio sp. FNV 38]
MSLKNNRFYSHCSIYWTLDELNQIKTATDNGLQSKTFYNQTLRLYQDYLTYQYQKERSQLIDRFALLYQGESIEHINLSAQLESGTIGLISINHSSSHSPAGVKPKTHNVELWTIISFPVPASLAKLAKKELLNDKRRVPHPAKMHGQLSQMLKGDLNPLESDIKDRLEDFLSKAHEEALVESCMRKAWNEISELRTKHTSLVWQYQNKIDKQEKQIKTLEYTHPLEINRAYEKGYSDSCRNYDLFTNGRLLSQSFRPKKVEGTALDFSALFNTVNRGKFS